MLCSQRLVGDFPAGQLLVADVDSFVLGDQVIDGMGRSHVLRKVNVLHHEIGKVPLEDAAEIARRVADRVEHDAVEKLQSVGEPQLQGAFNDGADERLKTRIRVGDLQPVAGADDADGQHAGGMDEFNRGVDRIATDDLCFGVGLFPILDEIERRVFQGLANRETMFSTVVIDPPRFDKFVWNRIYAIGMPGFSLG